LKEPLPIPQHVEAFFVLFQLAEAVLPQILHDFMGVHCSISAPVDQCDKESQNRNTIHRVAGCDLTDVFRLLQRLKNSNGTHCAIIPQNGNPWLIQ
jgi:hypothetical protein